MKRPEPLPTPPQIVPVQTLAGHTASVVSIAVAPDGRCAVSAAFDSTLRVWDLPGGACRRTLEGHSEPVTGVAITPDGRRVVSVSGDRTLRVWDLATGALLQTLHGHV